MPNQQDSSGGHQPELPTPEQLKHSIEETEQSPDKAQRHFEDEFRAAELNNERDYLHLSGLKDHYRQKARWSGFLICLMGFMVVFQSILLGLVGAEIWTFEKYKWLLPALLVQNLTQVVGLAVFVVKALFKDSGNELLN